MDFDRDWTPFALDAEVEAFGTRRIAEAHNRLRRELRRYVREGRAPEGAVPDPAMIRALATWLDKEGFRGIHSGPIGEKLRAIADWLEEDVRTPTDREEATEHEGE